VVVGRDPSPFFGASGVSSRLFKILSSFTARSSSPKVANLPTSTDIPFSSCKGGNVTPSDVEDDRARKHAKATRAHSALGRYTEDALDAEEEGLLSPVVISGELMTRLSDRGCNGDGGNELDLRSALLEVVLVGSFAGACLWTGVEDSVLIALLRVLRVALMTSVANMDRSLGGN